MDNDLSDSERYVVLVNDEEQYSLWREGMAVPNGWGAVGPGGTKAECLEYINQAWMDMRPLSLRRRMDSVLAEQFRGTGIPEG